MPITIEAQKLSLSHITTEAVVRRDTTTNFLLFSLSLSQVQPHISFFHFLLSLAAFQSLTLSLTFSCALFRSASYLQLLLFVLAFRPFILRCVSAVCNLKKITCVAKCASISVHSPRDVNLRYVFYLSSNPFTSSVF